MKHFFTFFLTFSLLIFGNENSKASVGANHALERYQTGQSVLLHQLDFTTVLSWFSLSETSMAIICPTNQDITLAPSECGTIVNYAWQLDDINATPLKYYFGQDTSTVNSTYYCPTGITKYSSTFYNGSPTDVTVKYVKLGVYESANAPVVTLNFYDNSNNLLGSHTATIPNLIKQVYQINIPVGNVIKLPALENYTLEVVANPPVISVFKMGRNNVGIIPGFSDATITSSCASLNYMYEGTAGGDATLMVVNGLPDDYIFKKTNNAFVSSDYFPIGTHNMDYVVTDANGNSTACPFTITVREFPNVTNVMACLELVQVSLDEKCETVVTSDMILKGDEYGCSNNYEVQIFAENGKNLGNIVDYSQNNKTLKVQVINNRGNSCWGNVLIQDKFGPQLECHDVYTTCSTDLAPGSPLSSRVPVSANIINKVIPDNGFRSVGVNVANLPNSTITDVNVFIDISHPNISQLAATLTSPDGVTVPLFDGLTCPNADLMVTLDEQASALSTQLISTCQSTSPAAAGTFRAMLPLSVFNGKPLEGEWVVNIFDKVSGVSGYINHIDIIFSQTGGYMPFPTTDAVTFVDLGDNIYQVEGIDNCSSATLHYTDTVVEEDCASIYSQVIRRCWTGEDAIGNKSNDCCQYIYVYRNGLSTLQFPPNFDGLNGNPDPLSCVDYQDQLPSTDVTGLPFGDLCGNVQIVEPVDDTIHVCANSYKIIRTHKVVEWCSGQVIVHIQIIKVLDQKGPEMKCPADITVSADEYDCFATYNAEFPEIIFDCSDDIEANLSYLHESAYGNTEHNYDGVNQFTQQISGLPFGENEIFWNLTDACGNTSTCSYFVTVADQVRPVAVCDKHTIASLTGNGKAVIDAETFDDGSLDNCGIKYFEARKMSDKCGVGTNFGPEVVFCCDEIGTTIMVEFRVTDLSNNQNTCMVEVEVQDKLPPYITKCPADVTLNCQADFKDFVLTGYPEYVDNCTVESIKNQDDPYINNCGVGYVTRTWTVTDLQNLRHSCVQNITLVDDKPFVAGDITWPDDYTTNKCHSDLSPDALPAGYNRPTFKDDYCSLVAATYKDQVFKFVDGACEKILRTWTVIDWCTYDDSGNGSSGYYQKIQIIKIHNDIPPSFEFSCIDRSFKSLGNCEEKISFSMYAIDDCPEDNIDLNWKYELDVDDNGTVDAVAYTYKFDRVLKDGNHSIKWTVEDKCGNIAYCTHKIEVEDSKKPTPYCLSSLTTAVMNSDGTISIWAIDYDKGSFDNCTAQKDLIFTFYGAVPNADKIHEEHYFKGNGVIATKAEYLAGGAQIWIPSKRSSGIVFDCNDITDGVSQEINISMWVTDLAGNQDYCDVRIVLQDNSNFCKDGIATNREIDGNMKTVNALPLSDVVLSMTSNTPELNKTLASDASGYYSFENIPTGSNVEISASKNGDLLNGVSTLDLVYIQRHILNIETLNDPLKIIAADADNNANITVGDLSAIRKAILGITTEFPNNQKSWRFLPEDQSFANEDHPFPFTEKYTYSNISLDHFGQNFVGIKIGDVNNSASNDANDNTDSRAKKSLDLYSNSKQIEAGQIQRIDVYVEDEMTLSGIQMTIQLDPNQVDIINVSSILPSWNAGNYSLHATDRGFVTVSWDTDNTTHIPSNSPIFTLEVQGKNSGNLRLDINSAITRAEAYDDTRSTYNLGWRLVNNQNEILALQNNPNPFTETTLIPIQLPIDTNVDIEIKDVTGKIVFNQKQYMTKGNHQIMLKANDLGKSGVYICTIRVNDVSKSLKMILLE
ncbi:MAG: HYR domain-containing protein [Saprospiraceae bacterium]